MTQVDQLIHNHLGLSLKLEKSDLVEPWFAMLAWLLCHRGMLHIEGSCILRVLEE
jgi:hypothetical protein